MRFRLFPFRSPLLRESPLRQRRRVPPKRDSFSSPRGTEMFHFPRSGLTELFDSPGDVPLLDGTGFPIRKSPDHSLLTAPRSLSQLHHVLHRLLTPRHPPEALSSLTKEHFSLLRKPRRIDAVTRDADVQGAFSTTSTCQYSVVKERAIRCIPGRTFLRPLWR
jgi:hypothetical protein